MTSTPHNQPRRVPAPWLRSIDESRPRAEGERRPIRPIEALAAFIAFAAVVAFFVWFLFLATGGPGPGTV